MKSSGSKQACGNLWQAQTQNYWARSTSKLDLISSWELHALDITATSICEIHYLALDGFDVNTAHKLSSKEKKYRQSRDWNPALMDGKQECFLYATKPPPPPHTHFSLTSALFQPYFVWFSARVSVSILVDISSHEVFRPPLPDLLVGQIVANAGVDLVKRLPPEVG